MPICSPIAKVAVCSEKDGGSHSGFVRLAPLALLAIVALTRAWAVWEAGGFSEGEPDSALFTLGVWRWSHLGPHAGLIYDHTFSAGYYALAAWAARLGHLSLAAIAPGLDALSCAAALATAALVYALARHFVSGPAAFWSSLLFMLAPGVWELSLEPHPQGLGICLALVAFYCCLHAFRVAGRHRPLWLAAFALALTAALLVRSDAVFLYPAFLAAAVVPPQARQDRKLPRIHLRPPLLAAGAGSLLAATLLYFAIRALLLHQAVAATESTSWHQIAGYIGHLNLLKQALPFVTGLGPAVVLLALIGLILAWRFSPAQAGHGLLWLALWSLPSAAFWFLVRGNNARHVAIVYLPVLWFACEGWQRFALHRHARAVAADTQSRAAVSAQSSASATLRVQAATHPATGPAGRDRAAPSPASPSMPHMPVATVMQRRPSRARGTRLWLALVALVALGFDFLSIPASSDITLYPSGNVPASFSLLHHRQRQMRWLAAQLIAASTTSSLPVCYLGTTTSPYVLLYAVEQAERRRSSPALATAGVVTTLKLSSGGTPVFHNVYSSAEYLAARRQCSRAMSLEYDALGRHLWFFGQEWHWLPFHRRWYAATVNTPES